MVQILGIVNLTRDSFSDGGRYLAPADAIAHARRLVADGAAIVDLGAESTHPDSETVDAGEEIARLMPVAKVLIDEGIRVSIDTHKPQVMRAMLNRGAAMINDVTGLADPAAIDAVRDADAKLVVMHSRSPQARAERRSADAASIVDEIVRYFEQRIARLEKAGVASERLILDPGMGFFLGDNPEASLAVLRAIPRLKQFGLPILVSTSRKSFIGSLLGEAGEDRPINLRAAGTLASELWTAAQGADFIRTHDVRAISDALRIWRAIADG